MMPLETMLCLFFHGSSTEELNLSGGGGGGGGGRECLLSEAAPAYTEGKGAP